MTAYLHTSLIIFTFFLVSQGAVDLIFAIEGSKALGPYFDDIKKTVIKMTDRYKISKDGTHVGVLEFSDSRSWELRLDATDNDREMKTLISEIRPSGGEKVDIGNALHDAREMFKVKYGGRAGYPKVLVLITGSKSDGVEPLKEAVQTLKKDGIQLLVVAVGNNTDRELPKISPNADNIDDPEDLPEKADDLVDKINKHMKNSKWVFSFKIRKEL